MATETTTRRRLKCPQCQLMAINGIPCHETGCPLSHIDPNTDKPYHKECKECGCNFEPENKGQILCSDHCANMHYGQMCGCVDCETDRDCDAMRELADDETDGDENSDE